VLLAQAERRLAREVERRAALQTECAELRLEVRRLQRLLKASDAGRVAELRAQVERLKTEVEAWKSGRR
jgi:septal ring factor EnvC (AmiA/AmiB activator)